jgi:hypothetical protein
MPRYVIEREFSDRFVIPLSDDGEQRCKDVVDRNAEAGVTWLHSYVSDDHKRSYCVYDGPNPEAIRRSAKQNHLPVSRITEVRVLDPYFYRP